jgi:phosphatidate cytidylyltransferase
MKRVLTAVVLIPLVLPVLFKAPLWLFTLVVGVVAMGAVHEYLELLRHYNLLPSRTFTLLITGTVFSLAVAMSGFAKELNPLWCATFLVGLIISSPAIFIVASMRQEDLSLALPSASTGFAAIPYVVLTLLCLPLIRAFSDGVFLILFMFVVVWSGDIFAYYAGRAFGKHKLARRISPGKTWEGTFASFLGSVFLAHILFVDNRQIMEALFRWHIASTPDGLPEMTKHLLLLHGLILGAFVNVAAQIGDLVESMIKRGAGAKDSGTLLPGHGGILDRIDALLFALPVVAFYTVVGQFRGVS